mmetsp:Transcript_25110/g.53100  ORF Transcript_25110/g.53100 Transcript_25110/m.53100 type:complete len:129 (+) Transcript_25110:1233-1619(+)
MHQCFKSDQPSILNITHWQQGRALPNPTSILATIPENPTPFPPQILPSLLLRFLPQFVMQIGKEPTYCHGNANNLQHCNLQSKDDGGHDDGKYPPNAIQCCMMNNGDARQDICAREVVRCECKSVDKR